mmetsp:Transcript_16023/g.11553  ORF Transcript_16023/g.11553 Transcript_16023/m.11553 type:complete len:103 (+) Transcript_16023:350-658(+)
MLVQFSTTEYMGKAIDASSGVITFFKTDVAPWNNVTYNIFVETGGSIPFIQSQYLYADITSGDIMFLKYNNFVLSTGVGFKEADFVEEDFEMELCSERLTQI